MLSRDFIILFTDGAANCGITDAYQLVNEYKRQQRVAGFTYEVPISAITIGQYQPLLLMQVNNIVNVM